MADRLTARTALAIGHKMRLLERIEQHDSGSLTVPCPHPGCTVTLYVQPADDRYPLTLAWAHGHGHPWTLAHRECVEILVAEWPAFAAQRAEPPPF